MERRLQRSAGEMSELGELHAVLDVGLGALRTEIAEVRNAVNGVAGDQGDVEDRLEAFIRGPAVPAEQGRGRKGARKGEPSTQIAALLASTEDLAQEHQQLKAHVARLQQAADAATAAAARASSHAAAASPFRSDVRLLQEQVAAQNEALEALRRSLERLRRKSPGAGPAAKPGRPSTKD
jgi:predicted RNase H-like nuclease (RuvC/YqgF family)